MLDKIISDIKSKRPQLRDTSLSMYKVMLGKIAKAHVHYYVPLFVGARCRSIASTISTI